MSIWKSPVFYFGILLALVVTAALAAPYVVPWNNYRTELETFGRKLTGRDVTIDGDIAVKLFPWPQLQARQVAIGNPDGFSDAAFVKADAMRVRLSLGGLFNGSIDVQSVEIEKPEVNLLRSATGDVNWVFTPQEQVAGQGLLSRVKLDQILVSHGILSFDDLRNGHSVVLTDLDATLSAQSILGPWRSKGSARWSDVAFDVSVVTSAKEVEQPLKFTVKVTPQDLAYPQTALEGAWDGVNFKGAVRVDPQESKGEKQSAEGAFKPLTMQALVEASAQRLSLLKIKITPSDKKDSGTLIEGDAVVEFGSQAMARLDLKSPRIDLDPLGGSSAIRQWRDGGFLSVANQLLLHTPVKFIADYKFSVNVLTSGGQALNDVHLTGSLQKEALRVHEFVAELPGRSIGVFDGILFPGQAAAQLAGKFKFESADSRAFLSWLAPTWCEKFQQHWTGNRGRLLVQSGTLDWTRERIALNEVNFEFDGTAGKASLTSGFGVQQNTELKIAMEQLDIDGLVPNGWSLLRDGGGVTLFSHLGQQGERAGGNTHLELSAKLVLLNGVSAQDAMLDVSTQAAGFDIKQLSIGNVGGAKLQGGGALLDTGSGPEGELKFNLQADDPRGFLRLTGLEYGGGNWTQALGQTRFDVTVKAVPQKNGPEIEIVARGSSGALNAELVASARDLEKGTGMTLAASGGLNSADSAALAKLLAVQPAGPVGAGDLTFEFNGSVNDGFVVSTRLKALDAVAEFSGTANVQQAFLGPSGKFSLRASDGRAVLQALGVPMSFNAGQSLELFSVVATKDGVLSFIDTSGHIAGQRFSGNVNVAADKHIEADIESDILTLRDVAALVFMPWEGAVDDSAAGFADLDSALTGEVYLRPLQFETGTADGRKEVVVGLGFAPGERRLSVKSGGEQGLNAEMVLKPRGDSFDIEGSGRWPVDLKQHFQTKSGTPFLQGELALQGSFKSTGRSPAAALAALEGTGEYSLVNGALSQMTLSGFAAEVGAASTPQKLSTALANLDLAPGTDIGSATGNFKIENGALVLSPIPVLADGVDVSIAPQMDSTTGTIKVSTRIQLKQPADLPPVMIVYEGTSGAFDVRNGTSVLAAKLGYALLSKEMSELERLQQEQAALAAKEEAQRRSDEQRFADYQNTRSELRGFARVRRFHKSERERREAVSQNILDAALKASATTARIDVQRHARRLMFRRGGI
jgi:uncharacterized protein involved in outer membrane biogenesis